MKLEQIEIENFRCFEHLTVVLDPEVNAFIGINASGKTAILDAIAIALHSTIGFNLNTAVNGYRQGTELRTTDIRQPPGDRGSVNSGITPVRVIASATGFPDVDRPGSLRGRVRWTDTIEFLPPKDFDYSTEWQSFRGLTVDEFDIGRGLPGLAEALVPTADLPLPVFAYYRAHRRFAQMPSLGDIFKLKFSRESAYQEALDAAADYGAMCRWFYMRENQELRERDRHRDQPDLRLPDLEAIRAVLPQMLDQVTRVFFDDNPPRLKVEMKDAQGLFTQLEVEQLSDGYRNLLAVALDFARRLALANPILAKPLEAPGILLIDEIELHLHPKWQQTVVPRLRAAFPNTQIIVTTHSPLVLTSLHARQIRIVRDQQVFAAPIETYGADALRTARLVMDTQSRPPDNPNTLRLGELFDLINRDQVEDAAAVLAELEATLGAEDPALVDARTSIENRRWQQEMGL